MQRFERHIRRFLCICILFAAVGVKAADITKDEKLAAQRLKLSMQFDGGHRYALIIGINKYKDPHMGALRFCVNDSELMADVLVKKCGYPRENVLLLNDNQPPERQPGKVNILRELGDLLKKTVKGDTVLVFYAGHGNLVEGKSVIDTNDVLPGADLQTGVAVEQIRGMLHKCAATQKVLILDSCHSGAVKGELGFSGEDLGDLKSAGGLITFAGCRRGQESKELAEVGHGLLTYCLARGLAGEADYDHDGIVDSDEVYRFVFAEVPVMAQKMGPGVTQTPVRIIGEDVTGLFALARTGGEQFTIAVPRKTTSGSLLTNSMGMKLSIIMPGTFKMGSPDTESGRNDDERRWVIQIIRPYLIGTREVTQAEYEKVMGKNPSYFCKSGEGAAEVAGLDTSQFPVEQVSWDEAVEFCTRLSKMPEERIHGLAYRLPTEAEWEYACRAGTQTVFNTGDLLSPTQANVNGDKPYLNSPDGPNLKRTTAVGSYKANAWGLHDMHGNVWEWCSDYYAENTIQSGSGSVDPHGPESGTSRVIRGGCYSGDVSLCRSAQRRSREPDFRHRTIGFRVVAVPIEN